MKTYKIPLTDINDRDIYTGELFDFSERRDAQEMIWKAKQKKIMEKIENTKREDWKVWVDGLGWVS